MYCKTLFDSDDRSDDANMQVVANCIIVFVCSTIMQCYEFIFQERTLY